MKFLAVKLLVLGMFTAGGCDSGCDVGETWCDDDLIILCVSDDDDYWEDDYDDSCGFFCDLLDFIDTVNRNDSHPEEDFDCADIDKTCVEKRDDNDDTYAVCGYDQSETW
jgi:hypothetical protein